MPFLLHCTCLTAGHQFFVRNTTKIITKYILIELENMLHCCRLELFTALYMMQLSSFGLKNESSEFI